MKDREQTRVYMSSHAKREIEKICATLGVKQIDLLSRLCEWFAKLDKAEKLRVLGVLAPDEEITPKS